jgi:SRSO17 transposase
MRSYADTRGRALIDRELYLPKSWIADRDRCQEAAVPGEVEFATKTELARQMLGRALEAGVPAAWVTADEAYGQDSKFRAWLEQRRIGYVVAVACNQAIAGSAGTSRADVLAGHAPQQAWQRRSCGDGAKGPRVYDWAVASLPAGQDTTPPGWSRWLLVRRSLTCNAKGEHELAYYLCSGPATTTDEDLIRVAGSRRGIEEQFQAAKGQVGLDHYQVRSWTGWHRHITLAMLALAFLMACTATAAPAPPADPWHHAHHRGPLTLTAAEIRRLFTGLATGQFRDRLPAPAHTITQIQHWFSLRRHHQGRARHSHYQRRLTTEFGP